MKLSRFLFIYYFFIAVPKPNSALTLATKRHFIATPESVGSPDSNDGKLNPTSGEHLNILVSISAFLKK